MRPRSAQPPQRVDPYTQLGTLLAGPITWGLIGWGLDHLLGTAVLVPVGLVLGIIAATWLVVARHLSQLSADPPTRLPGGAPR